MKTKSITTIILLVVNFSLIILLTANRIIVWKNLYGADECFLGIKFHSYRYSISKFSVYLPHFFAAILILSFFLKNKRTVQYLLVTTSIIGFLLAWKAFDYFAPW
jgi:ABC-type multidrug transport system permease subunit